MITRPLWITHPDVSMLCAVLNLNFKKLPEDTPVWAGGEIHVLGRVLWIINTFMKFSETKKRRLFGSL